MGCIYGKTKVKTMNSYVPPEIDSSKKLKREDLIGLNTKNIVEVYDIQKTLGMGGYGEVKLALHKKSNFLRAVKIVRTANFTDLEKSQANLEIDILRKLVFFLNKI